MTTNNNELELVDDGLPVFENDHYFVDIVYLGEDSEPYVDGKFVYRTIYAVVNKQTEVIEHACVQLPEAIFCAVGLSAALDKAPWKWAREVAEAADVH